MKTRTITGIATAVLVALSSSFAKAETIELTDGKILSGTIQSMNAEEVAFQSDDNNETKTISRDKIAQITFVDRKSRGFSVSALLRELRAEGIDDEAWADVKKRIRVMETPELKRYFNDTIAGLKADMENLRRDAKEVEDEITELSKEYGPEADTLNDYLIAVQSIFSPETETEATLKVEVETDEEHSARADSRVNRK